MAFLSTLSISLERNKKIQNFKFLVMEFCMSVLRKCQNFEHFHANPDLYASYLKGMKIVNLVSFMTLLSYFLFVSP